MFEDSLDVLEKFLNCCKSAKNKIYIWPKVYEKDSIENYGYNLQTSTRMLNFLTNNIEILACCKPELLNYGKNNNELPVYGYKFIIKDGNGQLGYFAFVKFPQNKSKYKWQLKSLHKDVENNDVIDFYIGNGEQIIKELSGLVK